MGPLGGSATHSGSGKGSVGHAQRMWQARSAAQRIGRMLDQHKGVLGIKSLFGRIGGYRIIALILGPVLIIWFAAFGLHGDWNGTWHSLFQLLGDTLTKKNLYQLYSGSSWIDIYYTCRFVFLAIVFAYGFGLILTVLPILIRWRPFVAVYETLSVLLESVPDTLYIIGTNLGVIFLLDHYMLNLPVFEVSAPTWYTTLIPAFVLAGPSIFYLKRLWSSQLDDEAAARYVDTARAKGASGSRIFWRHILPNLGPLSLWQLPFIATMILSTSLFAELFMEYRGQLFAFATAVGLDANSGELSYPYHMGLVVVIGLVLVFLWWAVQLLTGIGQRALFPANLPRHATSHPRSIQISWILVGAIMVAIVLFVGTFPRLFTHFSPTYQDLGNSPTMAGPPFKPWPPSKLHPLGTDTLGRDVLSQVLYGVYNSIYPAIIITLGAVAIGTVVAVISSVSRRQWLVSAMRVASTWLSSIPTLFIMFLALYHRTDNLGLQLVQYMLWFVIIESLRSSYPIYVMIQSWFQFDFVEGARSVGQSRLGILFSHLKSWLRDFLLEFSLSSFVRVMSIMTQLAAFHIYIQATIGPLPFKPFNSMRWPQGLVSAHVTWFGMIGDSALNGTYFWDPVYLLAPVIALTLLSVGVNLITHGLRGGGRSQGA